MAFEFVAVFGSLRGASLMPEVGVGGGNVQIRLEGLTGRWIEQFSVGTNPDPASLTRESEGEIATRFGRADILARGHDIDVVSYSIRMTSGMVHLAEAVIVDGRGEEPLRETRTVLVVAIAAPAEMPGVVDVSVGGTFVEVHVPLPGAQGDWSALGLTAKSAATGTPIAQTVVALDFADRSKSLPLIGPPLRPGHDYLIDVTISDPTGVAARIIRDRPVTLLRRLLTVRLTEVVVFDDLDAGTTGDFKLYARIVGRLSNPDREVEHAFVGSAYEFKLDSSKPNGPPTYALPVFPDYETFEITDGPAIVDEDRDQVWITLVASENDAFETERAYGSARLRIPNTYPTSHDRFEALFDQPIGHWDAESPGQAGPAGVELWTEPLEDPRVRALKIRGTYSIQYKA